MRRVVIEAWLPVVGFPGYEASALGRVRSFLVSGGTGGRCAEPHVLTPYLKSGYPHVNLRRDGETVVRSVHTLVLEAFVGPCPRGLQARHFPCGDKSNATIGNLSWATSKANNADKLVQGTAQRGETHPRAVMCDARVMLARFLHEVHEVPWTVIGEWMEISKSLAWSVGTGKTWTHLPAVVS